MCRLKVKFVALIYLKHEIGISDNFWYPIQYTRYFVSSKFYYYARLCNSMSLYRMTPHEAAAWCILTKRIITSERANTFSSIILSLCSSHTSILSDKTTTNESDWRTDFFFYIYTFEPSTGTWHARLIDITINGRPYLEFFIVGHIWLDASCPSQKV